jgi:hypothetical protein
MANTERQNNTSRVRQERLLTNLERSFSKDVRKEKNRFIEAQADHYKRARRLSEDILSEHAKNLKIIFRKHYETVIRVFAGEVFRMLTTSKSFSVYESKRDFLSTLVSEFIMEVGFSRVKSISETTMNDLRKIVEDSLENEDPVVVILARILTARMRSRWRADTIARTEVHNAAMFASKRSAELIQIQSGKTLTKRWIPTKDERTRFSHAQMSTHKPIFLDSKFKVGRPDGGVDLMDRPGDPNGSAGNVINCRCVMIYESPDDLIDLSDLL